MKNSIPSDIIPFVHVGGKGDRGQFVGWTQNMYNEIACRTQAVLPSIPLAGKLPRSKRANPPARMLRWRARPANISLELTPLPSALFGAAAACDASGGNRTGYGHRVEYALSLTSF